MTEESAIDKFELRSDVSIFRTNISKSSFEELRNFTDLNQYVNNNIIILII